MIYDYTLSTGDSTISGCFSSELGTDRGDKMNLVPMNAAQTFYFDEALITGDHEIQLFLNSQSLFQEVPTTGLVNNEIFYQIFTGDFFIKKEATDLMEEMGLFFASNTPVKATSNISYDKFTGSFFAGTGMNAGSGIGNSLGSGISGTFPSASFDQFDFFLNGQKVYSGLGVSGYREGAMTTFIPNFVDGQGIVTAENEASFKATAYWKTDRIQEITGVSPDVFGPTFIEGQTNFYINGAKEEEAIYLELYSGVTMIEAGVSVVVGGLTAANTTRHYLAL